MADNSKDSPQFKIDLNVGDIADGANVKGVHIENYHAPEDQSLENYLHKAVYAYEVQMYRHLRPAPLPDQPYKSLYSFDLNDKDIFFGRDAAIEELYKKCLQDRLTVVHARSGAGKTSLLQAGLAPRLLQDASIPVYARVSNDPVKAIKQAIAPLALGQWPEALEEASLAQFLSAVSQLIPQETKEWVIILDQFEEFFVFWPLPEHRQNFIEAFAECIQSNGISKIRFVLSLRKDYFSDLAEFQRWIPNILSNEYRLQAMSREEAEAAITGPIKKYRPDFDSYETALLDALLADLSRGGMELPHLQIICAKLYEALDEGENTISLAAYEQLGRAAGVLSGYLQTTLHNLPGRGEAIAHDILKELVSSEGTKRAMAYDRLVDRIEEEQPQLDDVLKRLVNARLLRRNEDGSAIHYEMAHEYLIDEIKKWLGSEDLAFKQAEELLLREVANWKIYGTLIPVDRLTLLYKYHETYGELDYDSWSCLIQSAFAADFDISEWLPSGGDPLASFLITLLNDDAYNIRRQSILALGHVWQIKALVQLGNTEQTQQTDAILELRQLGDRRVVLPLIAVLKGELENSIRREVCLLLGDLGDRRAIEPLVAALNDEHPDVRHAAAQALREFPPDDIVGPLTNALLSSGDETQLTVVEMLSDLQDERTIEPLIKTLMHENKQIRQAAINALKEIGLDATVDWLLLSLKEMNVQLRARAGVVLAQLGDPRPGVCTFEPDMLTIPAGSFLMGIKREPHALDAFSIARYPTTNAQFQMFIDDGGYSISQRNCWSTDGWEWKMAQRRARPYNFGDLYNGLNQPVVGVSWYEAEAYANWLSFKTNKRYRLPSEAEWERAARHTDGRTFPWGDAWHPTAANSKEMGLEQTSPVGLFPLGVADCGASDMGGNVWEWTADIFIDPPSDTNTSQQNTTANRKHVIRGGSWEESADSAQATSRNDYLAMGFWYHLGFRLASSRG